MFLEFYGLREQPFGVTPDPRYLYFSPVHREALASLFYGVETGRGFLGLVAAPGMGKTTLLYQLLDRLKDSVRSVFLFQTQCDSRELMRYLLDGLGLAGHDGDFVRMHAQLNEYLLREAQAGRRVVLFIDEAQNLSDSALETVRLLTNFEAPDQKLLQIVLSGQPELAQRLARPWLDQLRQRISVMTRLHPLPPPEVARYIQHRLRVAGYDDSGPFTSEALTFIAECTGGVPRKINNLCFGALSLGCATSRKKVGPDLVREAATDLGLVSVAQREQAAASAAAPAGPPPSKPVAAWNFDWYEQRPRLKKRWLAFAVSIASILGLGGGLLAFGSRDDNPPAAATAAASQVEAPRYVRSQSPHRPAAIVEPLTMPVGIPVRAVDATQESAIDAAGQGKRARGDGTFLYTVRRNETISQLCRRFLGRYDAETLYQVRQLNPHIWNSNFIQAGDTIRLPQPKDDTGAARAEQNSPVRERRR